MRATGGQSAIDCAARTIDRESELLRGAYCRRVSSAAKILLFSRTIFPVTFTTSLNS
jgi:hypothetical protein